LQNNKELARKVFSSGKFVDWFPNLDFSACEILDVKFDVFHGFATSEFKRSHMNLSAIKLYNNFTGDFFQDKQNNFIYFNDSNLFTELKPINYASEGNNVEYELSQCNMVLINIKTPTLCEIYSCERKYSISDINKLKSVKVKPISTIEFFKLNN
jgi:hypothetical protein